MNENIKKARENAGFSQKQVAVELGVSGPTVCEWEKGKKFPSAENLKKLSKLYKVPTDYLLGLSQNSLYVEPTECMIVGALNPISALKAQYHIKTPVLAAISSSPSSRIEDILNNNAPLTEAECALFAQFFDISVDNLKKGIFPLFPNEKVQLKVAELTEIRFGHFVNRNKNTLRIITRRGEVKTHELTDEQLDALERIINQMPRATSPINHGEAKPSKNPLTYGAIAAEGGKENRSPKKKPKTT